MATLNLSSGSQQKSQPDPAASPPASEQPLVHLVNRDELLEPADADGAVRGAEQPQSIPEPLDPALEAQRQAAAAAREQQTQEALEALRAQLRAYPSEKQVVDATPAPVAESTVSTELPAAEIAVPGAAQPSEVVATSVDEEKPKEELTRQENVVVDTLPKAEQQRMATQPAEKSIQELMELMRPIKHQRNETKAQATTAPAAAPQVEVVNQAEQQEEVHTPRADTPPGIEAQILGHKDQDAEAA